MAYNSKKKIAPKTVLGSIIALIIMVIGAMMAPTLFNNNDIPNDNPNDNNDSHNEYYQSALTLTGEDLKNSLHTIISTNFVSVSYGDAREALADADMDPNDETKVLTIYSRQSVKRVWDSETWTREHVWPNSRLGVDRVDNSDKNIASDLHNLRAIVQSVNSSRGNKVFDNQTGPDTWFPGEEDKGDVARILLYMVVRYPHLSLVDEILDNDPITNYTLDGAKMARTSVLLAWHQDDPVDDFERHRNDVIYEWQKNRNPFIDHPEFVERIFSYFEPASYQITNVTIIAILNDKRNYLVWLS